MECGYCERRGYDPEDHAAGCVPCCGTGELKCLYCWHDGKRGVEAVTDETDWPACADHLREFAGDPNDEGFCAGILARLEAGAEVRS